MRDYTVCNIQWNLSYAEPEHNGDLSLTETLFSVSRIQTSSTYVKRNLPATEKKIGLVKFRCRQVSPDFIYNYPC